MARKSKGKANKASKEARKQVDVLKHPEFLAELRKYLEMKYVKKYSDFVIDVFENVNSKNLLPKYPLNTLEDILNFEEKVLSNIFNGYKKEYTDISVGAETAQEMKQIIEKFGDSRK
jgi:hypothetical protein